jgi:23S rRNA pseudouridine955/2504/2580 synthase/23S rRNA pseudouridine1911/1915/1917 synthase
MKKLDILYEDDEIVVINKTANILSIPDRYDPKKINLKTILENRYDSIYVVHRLDKDTSGVICFAKSEASHRNLNLQFHTRKIGKIYHLFCEGHPVVDNGLIDQPILKNSDGKGFIHKKGKPSQSKYIVRKKFRFHSLIEFELLSGRTHQARIHAAHIGCPLIVDPLYGNKEAFYLSEIKKKYRLGKYKKERPLLYRTPLHAFNLRFRHPSTNKILEISAPYPKDLRALQNQLTKWSSLTK